MTTHPSPGDQIPTEAYIVSDLMAIAMANSIMDQRQRSAGKVTRRSQQMLIQKGLGVMILNHQAGLRVAGISRKKIRCGYMCMRVKIKEVGWRGLWIV